MADFKIISLNIAMSSLSLSDVLRFDKPDLLVLQEVSFPTQTLCDRVDTLGYTGECNVDPIHPTLPGTAVVWRKTLNVSEVNPIIERRVISLKCGEERFCNVYAPSGTTNKKERMVMFNELATYLLTMGRGKLPIMAGDWNVILAECDTTRNFGTKYCKVLDRIVKTLGYVDCFRLLHPGVREYTFHRGEHMAQSRLDRVYIPPHLVTSLVSASHKPGLSDHCQAEAVIRLSVGQARISHQHKKSYWKLNTSLLDNPEFKKQFDVLYEKLVRLVGEYDDHAEWWEVLTKPAIASFCKDFSSKLSKERNSTKTLLYASLKIHLSQEDWTEVARTKEKIRKMLIYDMTGSKIRSRQNEHAEEEQGSMYHASKERKNNNLKKMRYTDTDGKEKVTDNVVKIEEMCVTFYDALLNGRHDKDLIDTGIPFQPCDRHLEEFLSRLSILSEASKTQLVKELTYEELEEIVKSCPNGKSPGLDGLPYELYKKTFDVIGNEFLEVVKAQLRNLALIESGKHGATSIPPKVEGIPDVTELRPLTLLCCDYRIMSKTLNGRLTPVMGEVVESSQLATGDKDKNILTGAYDIISTIDYINKNNKSGFIASYDMVKAYDRATVRFLLLVMEKMGFPELFRGWVKMLHHEATTCLVLPMGLSREIKVTFSFRQGDPIAMNLYILQQEPLLRMIRATLTGLTITNFKQLDKSYCDDIETLSSDISDLVKFDEVMAKFEMTSGAILSRTKKSKVMGIGQWRGRQDWPEEVRWMKVVTDMKIFGFTICPTYQQTLNKTWDKVVRGFEKVLFSWSSRQLDSLAQRVEVARIFALSKLYYVAQVLPLPAKVTKKINSRLSSFIFRGRHERLMLDELENSSEDGGLGLPDIAVKADALLLKQMCRMLNHPDEKSFCLLGYWLGESVRETGYDDNFPELAALGPVSHTMQGAFPMHQHMLNIFLEGVERREVRKDNGPVAADTAQNDAVLQAGRQAAQMAGRQDAWNQQQTVAQDVGRVKKKLLQNVTTKGIYASRMKDLLVPPKVEVRFPQVDFKLVYSRMNHKVLETRQKDVSFSIIHGLYKNRDRLFQQGRVDDRLCQHQACKLSSLVESVEHVFCLCFRVRTAWLWLRDKVLELMSDQGPAPVVSNTQLLMLMYPRCRREAEIAFLVGTFMELVDREVAGKQKELMVGTVRGVLRAKVEQLSDRAVPQITFPPGWF